MAAPTETATTAALSSPPSKREGGGKKNRQFRRYLLARHGETNFNKERRVQGTSDASTLTLEGISQASALGTYVARRQAGMVSDYDAVGGGGSGDDDSNNDITTNTIMMAPPITRTWCSPMTRCRQTYAAVSGCCRDRRRVGHPSSSSSLLPEPTVRHDLREIELREWQGRLREDVIVEDSANWDTFKKDPKRLRLGGGGGSDGEELFAPVLDCWERGRKNWDAVRSDAAAAAASSVAASSESEERMEEDGAIFIMCHGAMGQCMLLQALGIPVDAYGKSRKFAFDNCECVEIEWADDDYDDEEGERCSATRWRKVHPTEGEWQSASASRRMASGALSCGR